MQCNVSPLHTQRKVPCGMASPTPPMLKPLFGGIPKSSLVIHAELGFSKVA